MGRLGFKVGDRVRIIGDFHSKDPHHRDLGTTGVVKYVPPRDEPVNWDSNEGEGTGRYQLVITGSQTPKPTDISQPWVTPNDIEMVVDELVPTKHTCPVCMSKVDKPIRKATIRMERNGYTVDENGLVRNNGRFEGQAIYVPYFYEAAMSGETEFTMYRDNGSDGMESEVEFDFFEIDPIDVEEFPDLLEGQVGNYIRLSYSRDGFISGTVITAAEFNEIRPKYLELQEEWDND